MRLIDADELKKAISDNGYSHYFEIFKIIDNAPTIEERPQGEWINKGIAIQCSRCGAMYSISFYEKCYEHLLLNFCPNCGADMKGGAE